MDQRARILREIQAAGIDFSDATTKEGVESIASKLSSLTFPTTSECGLVEAIHGGACDLVDIVISDHALTVYDSQRLADVVTRTIQRGESAAREALRAAAGDNRGEAAS